MIIETSDNRFYRVNEYDGLPGLSHCWCGVRVARRGGQWAVIAKTLPSGSIRKDPIRKAGCRIVEAA